MTERALVNRLGWLSGLLMALDVLAFTAASSLFLSRMGAGYLPLAYVLQGLVAMLLFGALARHLEGADRARTLQQALALSALMTVVLAAALYLDWAWAPFAAFLWASFQWTLHSGILLPALLPDWLSGLSQKKHTPRLMLALSLGGIAAGLLSTLLAGAIGVLALWCLSLPLCAVCSLSLDRLVKRCPPRHGRPLRGEELAARPSLRQNFALLRSYPLVGYLAAGCFVFIVLYSLAEYAYFSVYQQQFGDADQLGTVLGATRVLADLLQLALLKWVTGPGLQVLGVATMGLIYPLACVLNFALLALAPGLPAALLLQMNSTAVKAALNHPAQSLCFNAMPHRLIALSRSLCEGSVQSLGLVVAGLLLALLGWLQLELALIAALAVLLSLLFVALRLGVARHYRQTLHRLTVEGVIDLSAANDALVGERSNNPLAREPVAELLSRLPAPGPDGAAIETALASHGEAAIAPLQDLAGQSLAAARHQAQRVLATINSPAARAALQQSLRVDYRIFERSWAWSQVLPSTGTAAPLSGAIADFQRRLHRQVLRLLEAMGHRELIPAVEAVLQAADDYRRAQALELLLSFGEREFVRPLTPLFETMTAAAAPAAAPVSAVAWREIAATAATCEDAWIARAARFSLEADDSEMDRIVLLQQVGIFEALSLDELQAIAGVLESVSYLPGERIFSQGEPGENLFVLVQGQVRLSHSDAQECRAIGVLQPGAVFGEMALLDDAPRSASADAIEACHLLKLHKLPFVSLTRQRPEIALAVARVLSQRLRTVQAFGETAADTLNSPTGSPA